MGLLDDAIREHLELKRRRGGDPSEIERAEREALGPVRRMPEPGDDQDFDAPYLAGEEDAHDLAYAEEHHLADEDEDADDYEPVPPPHRFAPSDEGAEFFDHPPISAADLGGHETAEYAVEHDEWEHEAPSPRPASPPGAQRTPHDGEEDVLEETPEFLQDTPDHDRLWFEQRPPRDFDFDG